MAIGGRTVGWDNTTPAAGDDAGLGDDEFRSFKTSIQTLIDAEHVFSTTGGANSGRHRPGSAMPYNDVQSNVSAGDLLGRLYFTSDTSRLFALGTGASDSTIFLGSKNAVEHGPDTGEFNHLWMEDSGHATLDAGGSATVSFASAYSGIPVVNVSIWTAGIPGTQNPSIHLSAVTTGGFQALGRLAGGTTASRGTVLWRSIGSRLV